MYINMCIYIKNCYNYILWNTHGNQKENTIKLNKRKRERNQDLSIQKQEKRKDATQRKTGRDQKRENSTTRQTENS